MKFDSQLVSRSLFLLFIICIAVYFMFINRNLSHHEGFEEDTLPKEKDILSKIVGDILKELYPNNTPSQKIINFYVDYASQRVVTKADLKEVIQGSAQALERTFNEKDSTQTQETTFGTEDEVTELYKEILLRNPDNKELVQYAKLLKEDKNFNMEKLKQILYASEEYKRLEKTQTNAVYSNLMGGVTDRQLTLMVTTYYKNVTGKDDIDSDTITFLKKKLLSFNLDDKTFKDFISKYLKGESPNTSASTTTMPSASASTTTTSTSSGISKTDLEDFKQQVLGEIRQMVTSEQLVTRGGGYTDQSSGEVQTVVQQPNKQVIEVLLKTAKENNDQDVYLDSQNVMKTIKEQAKCVFDKNAEDNHYKSMGPNSAMAALQDKRNTDDLRNSCIRNKKYIGIDEDMVLDPSLRWSVPQPRPPVCVGSKNDYQPRTEQTALIGTLLNEAQKTDVGSILPQKPPR
jgi:hypothetical protein